MKRILIISDTHRNLSDIEKLMPFAKECDLVVHLGDHSSDMRGFSETLGGKLLSVDGNCDIFGTGNSELCFEEEGMKIFACHGHRYGVKGGKGKLIEKAKELKADIALYGHTHKSEVSMIDGIKLINPGCLSRYSAKKSYCVLIINKGVATEKIVEII